MDASEALDDDGASAQVARLERRVLSARALAVVLVADGHPAEALGLVVARHVRHLAELARQLVAYVVRLAVLVVDGADEHVVGDVVQVAAILEPRTGGADVIGGALALDLDEDGQVDEVLAAPLVERLEELEARRLGIDVHLLAGADRRRRLIGVDAGVEAARRQRVAARRLQLELLAAGVGELVRDRVEAQVAGYGERGHDLGRGDEAVRLRVGVVAAREVAIVRGDDRVLLALPHVLAVPLADARTARVRQHHAAELVEHFRLHSCNSTSDTNKTVIDKETKRERERERWKTHEAVALNGGANLLGAGRDGKGRLGLEAVVERLLGDAGGARHVLVGAVCAAADEADLDLGGPAVLGGRGAQLLDRVRQIGRERTVDVRLELAQVDLDHLVVVGARVGAEQRAAEVLRQLGDVRATRGRQVLGHASVEGKDGRGGANLGAHVADGAHACARDGVDAGTEVLDDGAGAALDRENAGQLEYDVLGRRPAAQLAGQLDADHLGALELPRQASHHVHGVRAAHADAQAAETAAVGRVRVRADEQHARKRVVLQNNLHNTTT